MKQYLKFIIPFSAAVVLLAIVELMAPKKTDWSLSFLKDDKKPYGCYITYRMLPDLFRNLPESFPGSGVNKGILPVNNPVYNALKGGRHIGLVYIFINNNFAPDQYDMNKLMEFVREGNCVFISASTFNKIFSDSLKITTSVNYTGKFIESNFINSSLRNSEFYKFKSPLPSFDFSGVDSSASDGGVSVIGMNSSGRPDFIRIKLGQGSFYLNSIPAAFTNYNNLDSVNASYVYKAFSYLPADYAVLWDEYYKAGKEGLKNPLQFILSQESLRYAYYITIISIVLYIIFAGRRRQRIIPIITPPENTTLEFVNTVGSLYYQQKDHKNIAAKKITYFLDQLRNRYLIKTDEINDDTLRKIAGKSGLTFREIKEIFDYIRYINISDDITEKELFKINSLIETFYKKAGFHG